MVFEVSSVHMCVIPLGETRGGTFCGSRPGAWYLLVGNPYKPLFATVTGKRPHPRYTYIYHKSPAMYHVNTPPQCHPPQANKTLLTIIGL